MSLVFGSREVSMGPSMGLQGEREQRGISGCFSDYLNRKGDVEEEKGKEVAASGEPVKRVNGFCFGGEDLESSESSSIGVPDESDEEEEEVQSGLKSGGGALSSLDALEESLPIK
nr:TPA_asm: hypothetical protein HUJ06_004040 [Nelumbo nucifera]